MNITTFVYGLIDPRDGSYFYVGRTSYPLHKRLGRHLKDGKHQRSVKGQRIFEILRDGLNPLIVELTRLVDAKPQEVIVAEQSWIDFIGLSSELTNRAPASGGKAEKDVAISWTPEIIARLGKETNYAIAKDIGCSDSVVSDMRMRMGIPKYTDQKWTPENLARLGKEPDVWIAKDLGCAKSAVAVKRRKLGIPTCPGEVFRCPVKWTQELIDRLGKEADCAIAKDMGCSIPVITNKRKSLGIKAYIRTGHEPSNKNKLPDWVIEKLGTMSDGKLAEISGFTHRVIHSVRLRMDIPSYSELAGHPTRFQPYPAKHPRWG